MTTASRVEVKGERRGDVLLLHIRGRLDALSSESAEKEVFSFLHQGPRNVLLDFTEVNYLSSAGMRMLLAIFKQVKSVSGKLAVCSVEDGVLDVLKMSGFDEVLEVFATQDEALKRLAKGE